MALAAYVERTLARVRSTPADLVLLSSKCVPGTIFNGATGIALFCAEVSRVRGRDDALLARGREWLDVAKTWASRATPDHWRRLQRGFVYGETGIAYVDALLGVASEDRAGVDAAVERIEHAAERFDDLNEEVRSSGLVGGEAGVVVAAKSLLARLPESAEYLRARAALERIRDARLASLLALHASAFDPRPRALVGMAHGLAGELFVLVTSGYAREECVRARLEEIAVLRQVDPNGRVYWLPMRDAGDAEIVESWCNGTAGHTLLWSEVARLTGSEEARELAGQCARTTAFLVSTSAGLCCGLAGQSIALQRFADLSGDAQYSRRAYARLARAAKVADTDRSLDFAFWHGALGIAFAALARMRGEGSFPCVESLVRA